MLWWVTKQLSSRRYYYELGTGVSQKMAQGDGTPRTVLSGETAMTVSNQTDESPSVDQQRSVDVRGATQNEHHDCNSSSSHSKDELRSEYEQFSMTVCANGIVNIRNDSYGADADSHIYSVDPIAETCSCPHHQQRDVTCKHIRAVRDNPIVLSSAQAAEASYGGRMFTDGGSVATDGQNTSEPTSDESTADSSNGDGSAKQQQTQTCDECGNTEPVVSELTDVSDNDWNEYDKLCSECVIDVGGPDRSSNGDDSHGVVEVGRCRCGNTVTGDDEYCSERCREQGEIDTTPL